MELFKVVVERNDKQRVYYTYAADEISAVERDVRSRNNQECRIVSICGVGVDIRNSGNCQPLAGTYDRGVSPL